MLKYFVHFPNEQNETGKTHRSTDDPIVLCIHGLYLTLVLFSPANLGHVKEKKMSDQNKGEDLHGRGEEGDNAGVTRARGSGRRSLGRLRHPAHGHHHT